MTCTALHLHILCKVLLAGGLAGDRGRPARGGGGPPKAPQPRGAPLSNGRQRRLSGELPRLAKRGATGSAYTTGQELTPGNHKG